MKNALISRRFALLALAACIMGVATLPAPAADRGPWRESTTTTNTAANALTLPMSDTGRLEVQYIVFAPVVTTTQTVAFVLGTQTNTYGTKVVTTSDGIMAITNIPPLFWGDKILSTSATTNAVTATVVGRLFD